MTSEPREPSEHQFKIQGPLSDLQEALRTGDRLCLDLTVCADSTTHRIGLEVEPDATRWGKGDSCILFFDDGTLLLQDSGNSIAGTSPCNGWIDTKAAAADTHCGIVRTLASL